MQTFDQPEFAKSNCNLQHRLAPLLVFAVLVLPAARLAATGAEPWFVNEWRLDGHGGSAGVVIGGHVGAPDSMPGTPDGQIRLEHSAFGQPHAGMRPDFLFGETIVPPPEADPSLPPASIFPEHAAFYVAALDAVIAADSGNVQIEWRVNATETVIRNYLISGVPVSRPARLFWTERPWNAPTVNLRGKFAKIHYNSRVPVPEPTDWRSPAPEIDPNTGQMIPDNDNSAPSPDNATVWIDDQNFLHARGCGGLFIVEYFQTGSFADHIDYEIVEVLEPVITEMPALVGERLYPVDRSFGAADLYAEITRGMGENNTTATLYRHVVTEPGNPLDGALFAISPTHQGPWQAEVYWRHPGKQQVLWPFEVDWFAIAWPTDDQCTLYARDATDPQAAPVSIPDGLDASVVHQEPLQTAVLSGDKKLFYTRTDGHVLLSYSKDDDIWFEVIRSLTRDHLLQFASAEIPWEVGKELRPVAQPRSLAFGGDGLNFALPVGNSVSAQTVEFSMRPASATPGSVLKLSGADPANAAWSFINLRANATGHWELELQCGSHHVTQASSVQVRTGEWVHVALVLEHFDSNPKGLVTLYLDGRMAFRSLQIEDWSPWLNVAPGSELAWRFGRHNETTASGTTFAAFDGELRDLRVWKSALGVASVRQAMAMGESSLSRQRYALSNWIDFGTRHIDADGNGWLLDRASNSWRPLAGSPAAPQPQPLRIANLAAFDGSENYGTLPLTDARFPRAISMWVKADADAFTHASQPRALFELKSAQHGVFLSSYLSPAGNWVVSYRSSVMNTASRSHQLSSLDGWRHLAVVIEADAQQHAYLRLYVDGVAVASPGYMGIISPTTGNIAWWDDTFATHPNDWNYTIGKVTGTGYGNWKGVMDEVAIWSRELSASDVDRTMWELLESESAGLQHLFTFEDVDIDAMAMVDAVSGRRMPWSGPLAASRVPAYSIEDTTDAGLRQGWVYEPAQGGKPLPINPRIYDWNTADSVIIGVNALADNDAVEVWWTHRNLQPGMPDAPTWPGRVNRYRMVWPLFAPEIVLSGQNSNPVGTVPFHWRYPELYFQNDVSEAGFNPNEEHALLFAGKAYALRNDLNTATSSQPFVLVQYQDGQRDDRHAMQAFKVIEQSPQYPFASAITVGTLIQPPMPLTVLQRCASSYYDTATDPLWRDRKLEWWSYKAADDGVGTATSAFHYYYHVQSGFWFPDMAVQPMLGTEVPWLSQRPGGDGQTPVAWSYVQSWPDNCPTLHLGESLVHPKRGLPAIHGQKSVRILYQQAVATSAQPPQTGSDGAQVFDDSNPFNAVRLVDPTVERASNLSALPEVRTDTHLGKVYFTDLPPHLRGRLYYDPSRVAERLRLRGEVVTPVAGEGYLLFNFLGADDRARLLDLSTDPSWQTAVQALPTTPVALPTDDIPFDSIALLTTSAQHGYISVAMNTSTVLNEAPDPISVYVFKVGAPLYQGEVKAIESDNPLDEKLTMRHSGDFAGHPENYEFEWRYLPPNEDGVADLDSAPDSWLLHSTGDGLWSVVIGGPGLLTLSDNYFVCRWRPKDSGGPTGTAWSDWTFPMLAEGWIKRALNGINPFEQRIKNLEEREVNTTVSMIAQAGRRWEGDVPLNLDNIDDYGLIEIYETILKRGRMLSLDAGFNYGPANDALLLAAGRISDLYMILGNEAYGDAQDPTIVFGTEDRRIYGSVASSLFCFMNQVATLLEEELALLRGRDSLLMPPVTTAPVYNRLFWNFSKGTNGGEAAYALNYDIVNADDDLDGVISEADAAQMYPQGHGDAWGHYLTAQKGYYALLNNPNFDWKPRIEGMVIGGVTVNVDYYDERKFAAAAAAKARSGVAILDRTLRAAWHPDSRELAQAALDSDPQRAWGYAEWASRAGQGALFDWLIGNSMLVAEDTLNEGIQKIDRTTVPELGELSSSFASIQSKLNMADMALNPLGLAQNAVPFDISPADIDAGKTHFEQIYERAVRALGNSHAILEYAQGISQLLRRQADSNRAIELAQVSSETDFKNRLIELFGTPYPDDIGPGKTYPQGYDGPDLVHYAYVDAAPFAELAVDMTEVPFQFRVEDLFSELPDAVEDDGWTTGWSEDLPSEITINLAPNGMLIKPAAFTEPRRASGELQMAFHDWIQAWYAYKQSIDTLNAEQVSLAFLADYAEAQVDRFQDEEDRRFDDAAKKLVLEGIALGLEFFAGGQEKMIEFNRDSIDAMASAIPSSTILGMASGGDIFAPMVSTSKGSIVMINHTLRVFSSRLRTAAKFFRAGKDLIDSRQQTYFRLNEYDAQIQRLVMDLNQALTRQVSLYAEAQQRIEVLIEQSERCRSLEAEGLRLMQERQVVRSQTAERVQKERYTDMTFRIFRNEALGKFQSSFELAARYAALAARAYSYETALMDTDSEGAAGDAFERRIVRSRSIGRFDAGQPQLAGATGDPGIADALAQMKANWDILRGRYGFNNPSGERNRFSLRRELFRISDVTTGAEAEDSRQRWRAALARYHVPDLLQDEYFRRYCLPFSPMQSREPGLVIPFSSTIEFGRNFFGWPLAGGDTVFDSSHFATKVRGVGVWFSDYAQGYPNGLSETPRIYLIPVGNDIQRAPNSPSGATLSWQIVDQALPLPFDIGAGLLGEADWLPLVDGLQETLGEIRKYPSMRAFHDNGFADPAEVFSNSRLVGRSVWNTRWVLIIPAGALSADRNRAIDTFIDTVSDIKLYFQTYSHAGN